jgi:hypothetical protein
MVELGHTILRIDGLSWGTRTNPMPALRSNSNEPPLQRALSHSSSTASDELSLVMSRGSTSAKRGLLGVIYRGIREELSFAITLCTVWKWCHQCIQSDNKIGMESELWRCKLKWQERKAARQTFKEKNDVNINLDTQRDTVRACRTVLLPNNTPGGIK